MMMGLAVPLVIPRQKGDCHKLWWAVGPSSETLHITGTDALQQAVARRVDGPSRN